MASDLSRSRRVSWLRCGVGLSVLIAGQAHALTNVPLGAPRTAFSPLPGGGYVRTVVDPRVAQTGLAVRNWLATGSGAGIRVAAVDAAVIAGRAGQLAVQSTLTVGLGDGALAVARCLLGGTLICAAAGAAAAALYAGYRIYGSPEGLTADPGVVPNVGDGFCGTLFNGGDPTYRCYSSPHERAQAFADSVVAANYNQNRQYYRATAEVVSDGVLDAGGRNFTSLPQVRIMVREIGSSSPPGDYLQGVITIVDPNSYTVCLAGGLPGPDGLCPSLHPAPMSPEEAAQRLVSNPPSDINKYRQALQDSIDSGGQTVPATIETTGPASQTGEPTTTTTTTGTTTVTETKTPTYAYNYAGDTVTYNTTNNVTTTTNNNGTITSTTTTQTAPTPTPQDPEDPCTANPGRIGCQEAGQVADQPELYVKKTKTFTDALASFKTKIQASPIGSATGGFFNVAGGGICPTWTAHIPFINADLTIDQFCSQFATDALALFKAAVLVVAGIAAFRVALL